MRVDTVPVSVQLKEDVEDTAYRVTVQIGNEFDNTEETISFSGLFLSWPDAIDFKRKVIEKIGDDETGFGDLQLKYWVWEPRPNASIPELREEPIAQEWLMGRDATPCLRRKSS